MIAVDRSCSSLTLTSVLLVLCAIIKVLIDLVEEIVPFNMKHNAENEAAGSIVTRVSKHLTSVDE